MGSAVPPSSADYAQTQPAYAYAMPYQPPPGHAPPSYGQSQGVPMQSFHSQHLQVAPRLDAHGRPLHGGPAPWYQQPVINTRTVTDDQLEQMEEIAYTYSMSRSIKCFAVVDCCLVFFFALSSWYLLILVPVPLVGYWGAQKFSPVFTSIYASFNVAKTIGFLILFFVATSVLMKMLLIIVVFCEIYIFSVVIKFIRRIWNITAEDRELLENGGLPVRVVYW